MVDADADRILDRFDCWMPQLLRAVTALRVPDALVRGKRRVDDLATELSLDADALYRALRLLAMIGICTNEGDRSFSPTQLTRLLTHDQPFGLAELVTAESPWWTAWGDVEHSLRSGNTAFTHAYGSTYYEYLADHPDVARAFDVATAGRANWLYSAVVSAIPPTGPGVVVDIGGGTGTLLSQVLRARPTLCGVLVDRPHVVANADTVLAAAGVLDRCEVVPGDFFKAVPRGGDIYVLASVLHDWDDESARRILRTCREAMPPSGRLLVLEAVVPEDAELQTAAQKGMAVPAVYLDVLMLVIFGGRERTHAQLEQLVSDEDLVVVGTHRTDSPISVIEVRTAGPVRSLAPAAKAAETVL